MSIYQTIKEKFKRYENHIGMGMIYATIAAGITTCVLIYHQNESIGKIRKDIVEFRTTSAQKNEAKLVEFEKSQLEGMRQDFQQYLKERRKEVDATMDAVKREQQETIRELEAEIQRTEKVRNSVEANLPAQ